MTLAGERPGGPGAVPAPDPGGLAGATLARLQDRLAARPASLPFAMAVVRQVAYPLGGRARDEAEVAGLLADLLCGTTPADPTATLLGDPPLLAALFQNVDLLFAAGDPEADAVSALVMAALELAAELPPDDLEGECV